MHEQQAPPCRAPQKDLILEIGGSKSDSKPSGLPQNAVIIDAKKLPNPYTTIARGTLAPLPGAIIDWIIAKSPGAGEEIDMMVNRATSAFVLDRSVRIQCYGGAHRSQAIAWKILQSLDPELAAGVRVVCLDAPRLVEF
ncbi:MAG: hypothetical protein CMI16_05750 [Opitutaceae bacterium]|nr:hypothetical protein [Opitutaceae bacterium]